MRAEAMPGEDPETLPPPVSHRPAVLELVRADHEPPREVVRYRDWAAASGPR